MTDASATLEHTTSKDGTRIGFVRLGDGPPVVLDGQGHGVASDVLAPALRDFFLS